MALPAAFLSFGRKDESEADYLGVQYLYAAGYDPVGAVSIFEKIESLQKTAPGVVAKVFATHPMDDERIRKTEEVFDIGYEDYIYSGAYCFLEWPELVEDLLPADVVKVWISGDDERRIEF